MPWLLPLVTRSACDLKTLALDSGKLIRNDENLRITARILQSLIGESVSDRTPLIDINTSRPSYSKKRILLGLCSTLFQCYFKLNTVNMCLSMIDVVEREGGPISECNLSCRPFSRSLTTISSHEHYIHMLGTRSEIICYHYFSGRLKLGTNSLAAALNDFLISFELCPSDCKKARQILLHYIIPINMHCWKFPIRNLLTKFELVEVYNDIIESILAGRYNSLCDAMQRNCLVFIKSGVLLLLEKLKKLCIRNLVKKVWIANNRNSRLKLQYLKLALDLDVTSTDHNVDEEEIECLVCNLIYDGLVKGYVSHERKMLVLSREEPFPKVS